MKPVVLPGEELTVQVIKDGKEYHQGVAYLDDGTMIVVEEGREYIGKRFGGHPQTPGRGEPLHPMIKDNIGPMGPSAVHRPPSID